jgi:non-homologous end joining protein Ku
MAEALIESLSDDELDPTRYRDVRRETLAALIDAKATGRPASQNGEPGAVPLDLLGALRASIDAVKQRRAAAEGGEHPAAGAGQAKKKLKKPAQAERESDSPKKRR